MTEAGQSTSRWIRFFMNAGLPANTAANYAVIFTDHRIRPDMLLDLSKEYLFDMGITLLGDIIAILKYAKVAHIQSSRERMLAESLDDDQEIEMPKPNRFLHSRATSVASKSSPVHRLVGHYTKALPNSPLKLTSVKPQASRKEIVPPRRNTIISLKRKVEAPAPQKIRRVLPEHEGPYKIKMPAGTTVKTRKILQKQGIKLAKKSVFDRLGDSSVSSSTDAITKTKLNASVFQRLGPALSQKSSPSAVSSTSLVDSMADSGSGSRNTALPYRGVLKTTRKRPAEMSNLRVTKVVRTVSNTSVSDRRLVNSPQVSTTTPFQSSLFLRSLKEATSSQNHPASEGIFGTGRLKKVSIKTRLGQSTDIDEKPMRLRVTSLKKPVKAPTVFQRLGTLTL